MGVKEGAKEEIPAKGGDSVRSFHRQLLLVVAAVGPRPFWRATLGAEPMAAEERHTTTGTHLFERLAADVDSETIVGLGEGDLANLLAHLVLLC